MGPATLAHPAPTQKASIPNAPVEPVRPPLAAPRAVAAASGSATGLKHRPPSRIVVPVRYSAWLAGDLGRALERSLRTGIDIRGRIRITRLPRAMVVEADEEPGILLEAVHRSATRLEENVHRAYPVLYAQLGGLWTGTLQAVFDDGQ